MVIGFNKQFVPKILDGTKIHTIREDKTNRWCTGRVMHMATGVRTKNYNQFAIKTVVSIQKIRIVFCTFCIHIEIDDVVFYSDCASNPVGDLSIIGNLSSLDGFDSIDHFFKYFNKDFTGKIIHWTDKRY